MKPALRPAARYWGWVRIGVGVLLLLRTTPLLAPLDIAWLRSAAPLLGWPQGGFSLGFLGASTIQMACIVRTVAAVLFTLGLWTRAAGVVCGLAGFLIAAQYPLGFFFTIHLLYQAAILLAFTDAAAHLALRPAAPTPGGDGGGLMRAFVASIYLWAGLYKLRPDWLDGRTLLLFHRPAALHGWLVDWAFAIPWLPPLLAKLIAGFELGIGPLLLWTRTRAIALAVALAFHVVLELTAQPDLLGFGMMVLLLSFLLPPTLEARHKYVKVGEPVPR